MHTHTHTHTHTYTYTDITLVAFQKASLQYTQRVLPGNRSPRQTSVTPHKQSPLYPALLTVVGA